VNILSRDGCLKTLKLRLNILPRFKISSYGRIVANYTVKNFGNHFSITQMTNARILKTMF